MLQQRQLGLVAEDLVEDVGGIPHRGGGNPTGTMIVSLWA
jgi:hypothetical protein